MSNCDSTERVIISPEGKNISIEEMENIFEKAGAKSETIFRRLEFNQVIRYTQGTGIDFGCGLSKIHSCAIGIDSQMGERDFGYCFGANIKIPKEKQFSHFLWFNDLSVDFVFSSHCLEHLLEPRKIIEEIARILKQGGYFVAILPHMKYYPEKGQTSANSDHEWNCYPEVFYEMVSSFGQFRLVQLDTLHEKLKDVRLTVRDRKIAAAYGHEFLNFSFDCVFQKL